MTLLEGKSFYDAQQRVSEVRSSPLTPLPSLSLTHPHSTTQAYVPTLVRNWGVFVPTQILNFWLVPAQYRFFAVNTVALFWNAYLSAVNARTAQALPSTSPSTADADARSLEDVEAGVGVPPAAVKA